MTVLEAIKVRHSVRKYVAKPLEQGVVDDLRGEINRLNAQSGLRMQLVVNEPKAFKSLLAYGSFSNVSNYIMVVGKKSETLEYRAGYYCERLVLLAQRLGLNTCIVGLTFKKVDGAFEIAKDEKVVVCVAVGYGAGQGRVHKVKTPEQVSNIGPETPQWFARGVEAALMAPTSFNQQKFYFEYCAPDKVRPRRRSSILGYTKIDLGIAMYHFEVGAGSDSFSWIDSPLD